MAAPTLNSYKDVQNLLNEFVAANSLTPGGAPHGVFWETYTTRDAFVNGQVPNLGVPILVLGHPEESYIIQVLKGPYNGFPEMPRPNPPYDTNTPSQDDVITALSNWITANCPDGDAV